MCHSPAVALQTISLGVPQMAGESTDFLKKVFNCVHETEKAELLSDRGIDVLGGLSGSKTVGVLQRLTGLFADDGGACYLEIGVFQGLTLLSVAVNFPEFPCFGIDNFSILDPEGENLGIVQDRTAKLGVQNAVLINQDFEAALETLDDHLKGRKIGIYFVDGAHDYRSQLISLLLVQPYLLDNAVILIDDANYMFVRQSTRDFLITHPGYKMAFEAYSPGHPANLDAETLKSHEGGWLNGINILVRDPDVLLPDMLPPVDTDRTLYVNEWLVHRHQLAELAPGALNLAQAICHDDAAKEGQAKKELLEGFEKRRGDFDERYPDRNTYSAGLTGGRFNDFGP